MARRLWQPVFLKHLKKKKKKKKKTHQGILVWNRNKKLHTVNKKHVYKDRQETAHGEIGEMW